MSTQHDPGQGAEESNRFVLWLGYHLVELAAFSVPVVPAVIWSPWFGLLSVAVAVWAARREWKVLRGMKGTQERRSITGGTVEAEQDREEASA